MIKKISLTLAFVSTYCLIRWWFLGRKYYSSKSLRKRRVLVFGPTSTIGLELVKDLSSRQAEIIIASSDQFICEEIVKNSFFESNVQVEYLDFTRLQSVADFCDKISNQNKPIDIFISSAEIHDTQPELTEDRVDITFQTNYLCHYLAVIKLSQSIKKSRDGRIIFITSGGHKLVDRCPKKEYHYQYKDTLENRIQAYNYSKFCLTSFAWKVSDLLSSPNLSVHCVDPGKYSQQLIHQLIFKTPNEAIQGILFTILSEKKPPFYIEGIAESFSYNRLKIVREKSFDVNKHLIDKIWEDKSKGLRKEVINFRYRSIIKATEISKCLVEILNTENVDKHKTNYLLEENIGKEFWIELGHAVTPIDCYVEEFLKQMLTNETSNCYIETKNSGTISFTLRLKRIEFSGYYYEQNVEKMFELAKLYKENGVKMFKEYPLFAHNYFNLAAKCLLAFNHVDGIDRTLKDTSVTKKDYDELLQHIYLNISACLIKQGRHVEIIPILEFVRKQDKPSEKAVFRLATAYMNINNYQEAKNIIEKIDYKNNKELVQLMAKIQHDWKDEKDKDSVMAKKMLNF